MIISTKEEKPCINSSTYLYSGKSFGEARIWLKAKTCLPRNGKSMSIVKN